MAVVMVFARHSEKCPKTMAKPLKLAVRLLPAHVVADDWGWQTFVGNHAVFNRMAEVDKFVARPICFLASRHWCFFEFKGYPFDCYPRGLDSNGYPVKSSCPTSGDLERFRSPNIEAAYRWVAVHQVLNEILRLRENFALIMLGLFSTAPKCQATTFLGTFFKCQEFINEPVLLFQQGQYLAAPHLKEFVPFTRLKFALN